MTSTKVLLDSTHMKLTAEQFAEFSAETQRMLKVSRWRCGQAMFNALAWIHPELSHEVRNTPLDPFYDNERIGIFMNHILDRKQYNTLNPMFKMEHERTPRLPLDDTFIRTIIVQTTMTDGCIITKI